MRYPIAIINIATLMPGSNNYKDFWRDILNKKDFIIDVPKEYWEKDDYFDPDPKKPDKTYCHKGAFVGPVDFQPMLFGIPPKILSDIDSSQLLTLIAAKRLYDGIAEKNAPEDISVILGATGGQKLYIESASRLEYPKIRKAMEKVGIDEEKIQQVLELYGKQFVDWTENVFPGLLGNVIAGRVTNRLNFCGENNVVDAACASALAALNFAVHKLQLGTNRVVITGGVETSNSPSGYMCFSKTPALSPTMDIRPFSENADGTMLGEGIAMLALKRLEDAEKDNDTIYGVIKGVGASSDGRAKSIYAPSSEGQVRAINGCYKEAGFSPETVGFVEGHGTGTKVGDKTELQSMCTVFPTDNKKNYCALGSVKSQYGHTKAAAGAVGLAKAVSALTHRIIPPMIKTDKPFNMEDSAFYINTRVRPWGTPKDHPRRCAVSAFGFGGTNYHMVVEEYLGANRPKKIMNFDAIIPISGDTKEEVDAQVQSFNERLENAYIFSEFKDNVGYEHQMKFNPKANYRAVIILKDRDQVEYLYSNEAPVSSNDIAVQYPRWALFSGIEVVSSFDIMRENLEGSLSELYPVETTSLETALQLFESKYTIIDQELKRGITALFESFNINVTNNASTQIEIPAELSLSWFMRTLAELSLKGLTVDYTSLEREYIVCYDQEEKPKFSVPLSGFNYGKPTL